MSLAFGAADVCFGQVVRGRLGAVGAVNAPLEGQGLSRSSDDEATRFMFVCRRFVREAGVDVL